MKKINKIEAEQHSKPSFKKVAAYARVSANTERLEHSLSAQISYYSDLIQRHPGWEYVGVYADNGISGTETEKRKEFQRLISDCDAGKIDIVLTKSISRFARNTVDLLETVRHLKELGIAVIFEKENIDSLSADGELLLTLLASFAQEESRSISENVKWGLHKRMEQGIVNQNSCAYGYRWEEDHMVIVPEEAAVVKRIFQNFLDGKSCEETAREFAAEGITTRDGFQWGGNNMRRLLRNITYTGSVLLQKYYNSDPISKKEKANRGELTQYLVEDSHEAIIDMETFQYVQAEMARRRELGVFANRAIHTCCFTSKIKCPYCGKSYIHLASDKDRCKQEYWICLSNVKRRSPSRCPVKGVINQNSLIKACCEVLGMDEFDENIFLEMVDHIEVPRSHTLDFFLKDGTRICKDAPNTGRQDRWTAERREQWSQKYRLISPNRRDANCFTSKILCGACGNTFHRKTRHRASGEKYYYYRCVMATDCHNSIIRDDVLRELAAKALGMMELDEDVFKERIDHVTVVPGGHLIFSFYDGHQVEMTYSTDPGKPRPGR